MERFSRRNAVGMLATGFAAFLFAPAVAVGAAGTPQVRAGDVCKKLGRRQKVGNRTFECVDVAGKRQWKRAKAEQPPTQPTSSEVKVFESSKLALNTSETAVVTSDGRRYAIVLTRTASGVVAFSRSCTHAGASVSPNSSNQLVCPAHGSVFNASTGAVIEGPAVLPLTRYSVSERSGAIYITL
jgi:Rieske Fe-S protein